MSAFFRKEGIDLVTRYTASVVLLVYSLGFVILGFHDAKYGAVQFSPFRARIFLVGFVFLAIVTFAAAAQHYGLAYLTWLDPVRRDPEPKRRIHRDIVLAAGFIFTAALISSLLSLFLFRSSHLEQTEPAWRLLAWTAGYLLAMSLFFPAARIYPKHPSLAALLSLAAFAMMLAALFHPGASLSPQNYLTLVLAVVGWQTTFAKRHGTFTRYILDYRNWCLTFIVVWLYINNVFAFLPPRWGGGQPMPIQVFQNSQAPWSSSNPIDGLLLDETEQGFYILLSPNGKAFFVPRNNVASVFFGSKQELVVPRK